jgi:hypothetical protein
VTDRRDPIAVLLDDRSTWQERKTAVIELGKDSWSRGWNDCDRAYKEALARAALVLNEPVARA